MFSRYRPRAVRFEFCSRSCRSEVTIVAKFGQCVSGLSEKNVASPSGAVKTSVLG